MGWLDFYCVFTNVITNYICKNAVEIQSAHFGGSNKQATLHTGVVYLFGEHQSFTTISEFLRHDPSAIWAHLKPVLHELKRRHPEITNIHFFSDGPTTQYRNKANFYFFSTVLHQMGIMLQRGIFSIVDMARGLRMGLEGQWSGGLTHGFLQEWMYQVPRNYLIFSNAEIPQYSFISLIQSLKSPHELQLDRFQCSPLRFYTL